MRVRIVPCGLVCHVGTVVQVCCTVVSLRRGTYGSPGTPSWEWFRGLPMLVPRLEACRRGGMRGGIVYRDGVIPLLCWFVLRSIHMCDSLRLDVPHYEIGVVFGMAYRVL